MLVETFKFSQRGDQGKTSLLTGERVSKASLRPDAYGTLDEASSALGLAKASTHNVKIREMIESIQDDLVTLGAELACEAKETQDFHLNQERIVCLEGWIERLQEEISLPRHFVRPGANLVSAALDLSRAITRRAERKVVKIREDGILKHSEILSYLNRLADFLFVLARYAEKEG
jgi:cob(I)alamin adenosyltransferase